jgi:hypothetical protein
MAGPARGGRITAGYRGGAGGYARGGRFARSGGGYYGGGPVYGGPIYDSCAGYGPGYGYGDDYNGCSGYGAPFVGGVINGIIGGYGYWEAEQIWHGGRLSSYSTTAAISGALQFAEQNPTEKHAAPPLRRSMSWNSPSIRESTNFIEAKRRLIGHLATNAPAASV